MTKEQLLQPRYKVIADYPGNKRVVGYIFVMDKEDSEGYYTTQGYLQEQYFTSYPHLFRKMYWWEERKIEDLPLYIKDENRVIKVRLWKIGQHVTSYEYCIEVRGFNYNEFDGYPYGYTPSTEEEYKDYITGQSNSKLC